MRAALAGRQDPRLVIVGRTSALAHHRRRRHHRAAQGLRGGRRRHAVHGRRQDARQLDAVAGAVKLPLFLGGAAEELNDLDYLSARNVRVCLQGHSPIMAAINAVHATLKALREGKPGWEFENISPPSELMKRATRQADYAAWTQRLSQGQNGGRVTARMPGAFASSLAGGKLGLAGVALAPEQEQAGRDHDGGADRSTTTVGTSPQTAKPRMLAQISER